MATATRIHVTGAAGHLGSHLAPALAGEGYEVVGLDMAKPAAPQEGVRFVQASLVDVGAVREALAGVDLVCHAASIHPWKPYTDAQFIDANIKGTWELYRAASDLGIERMVLTSSIAAIGYHNLPPEASPIREDAEFALGDLYSFTKHAQEEIARMFAGKGKVRTIALRPPPFMPRGDLETGFSLLRPFAVVDDMVSAHVAAVKTFLGEGGDAKALAPFEAFFVTNRLPYTREDVALARREGTLQPLVQKYWPGAWEWLSAQGYDGAKGNTNVYDISKARRLLGWGPAFNFEEWFAGRA